MGHSDAMRLHGMVLSIIISTDVMIHKVGNFLLGHLGNAKHRKEAPKKESRGSKEESGEGWVKEEGEG